MILRRGRFQLNNKFSAFTCMRRKQSHFFTCVSLFKRIDLLFPQWYREAQVWENQQLHFKLYFPEHWIPSAAVKSLLPRKLLSLSESFKISPMEVQTHSIKPVEISIRQGWEGHRHSFKNSEKYPVNLLLIFRRYEERDGFFFFLFFVDGKIRWVFFQETQLNFLYPSGSSKILTIRLVFTEPLTERFSYLSRTICSDFEYWHEPYCNWASELTCTTVRVAGSAPSPSVIITRGLWIQTICRQMALCQNRAQPYFGS